MCQCIQPAHPGLGLNGSQTLANSAREPHRLKNPPVIHFLDTFFSCVTFIISVIISCINTKFISAVLICID